MTMRHAYSLAAEHAQGLPVRLLFDSYKILPAINKEETLAGLGVRHEVYCREKQFEKLNMAGVEIDPFDRHSTQLILSKKSQSIGCARFVHSEVEGEQHLLPIEKYGKDKLDKSVLNALKSSGYKYAEISRLAIHRDFRGGQGTGVTKGLFNASAGLITLIGGLFGYAKLSDTRYMMAFVERGLMKRLSRLDIPFITIGEPIEHRGRRYPILLDREQIRISPFLKLHFDRIHAEMEQHLEKAKTQKPTPKTMNFDFGSRIANDSFDLS